DRVVVATDAEEIAAACRNWGAEVEMTADAHQSGTERIGEVIARPAYVGFDVVVNVQGDEPFVQETHVAAAIEQVRRGFDIGTVAAPVRTLEAWRDPGVVKVTRRADGAALYFSRSAIPHLRDGDPAPDALLEEPYLRHVGLYAYRPDILLRWGTLPESALERIERLEQLRALDAGLTIGDGNVKDAEGGVNTLADAERAEQKLRSEQHT